MMMIDWQVMSATDQLRQRMAWALAQILVVGTGGFDHEKQNELWLNFYDILVRKAGRGGMHFQRLFGECHAVCQVMNVMG